MISLRGTIGRMLLAGVLVAGSLSVAAASPTPVEGRHCSGPCGELCVNLPERSGAGCSGSLCCTAMTICCLSQE
jgi:hypothetical protein